MVRPTTPYAGAWRVLPARSLEQHPLLVPGEILVHTSGATLLACPRCGVMQFTLATVTGPADRPTLAAAVRCASRHCPAGPCAAHWRVVDGATRWEDPPP